MRGWLTALFDVCKYCAVSVLVGFGLMTGAIAAVCFWYTCAFAASDIPAEAKQHQRTLIREARAQWGIDAPVAVFAAQIHQESLWRADAVSHAGAQGMAQFMPATARWLPEVLPHTGKPAPFSPSWAIRALVGYDLWLWKRVTAATLCDRMAMTLSAYNGGLGWVYKDQRLAASKGLHSGLWRDVAVVNAGRSAAAFRENRQYPQRILQRLLPRYSAAGWPAGSFAGGCHAF
jgi:soluble lytic murein transglycosylase-like protein